MRKILQYAALLTLALLTSVVSAQSTRVVGNITTRNLVAAGACTAGSCVEIDVTNKGSVGVQVSGTYTGALSAQVTTDGTTWSTLAPTPFTPATATGTPTATISSGATGQWQVSALVPGSLKLRITGLSAMTGTAVVTLNSSPVAPAGAGGGSSGGGDASAANQATQITAEQAIQASVASIDTKTPASPATAGNQTATQAPTAPATATATKSTLIGGVYNATKPTFTDGQQGASQLNAKGSAMVAKEDVLAFSGTCSAACGSTALVTVTTDGYESIELQMTSVGASAVNTFQCSSDNVTFTTCAGVTPAATGSSTVPQTTGNSTGQYYFPIWARYFRIFQTTYSSGTNTVAGYLRSKPFSSTVMAANIPNTITIAGQSASGTTASASPVRTASYAVTSTPTAVTNGQVVNDTGSTDGKRVVLVGAVPELSWTYAAAGSGISNTTTAVTFKSACTDRCYVTRIDLMCEALGTATEVAIRDGAGGTVLWRTKVGTGGLPLTNINFATPLKGTSATLLEVVTLTASGTGACYFNAAGYDAK
jgi:hypothetical protein